MLILPSAGLRETHDCNIIHLKACIRRHESRHAGISILHRCQNEHSTILMLLHLKLFCVCLYLTFLSPNICFLTFTSYFPKGNKSLLSTHYNFTALNHYISVKFHVHRRIRQLQSSKFLSNLNLTDVTERMRPNTRNSQVEMSTLTVSHE